MLEKCVECGKEAEEMRQFADEIYMCEYRDWETTRDRKSTRLNSSHSAKSRMPSSA